MMYQVLGPVRVTREDGVVSISQPKMERVLMVLLLRANQVVSKDALIAELWGSAPPRRATPALHVYISQLRKLLSGPGDGESPIRTHAPGYLLQVTPEQLDWMVLQRLVRQGRAQLEDGLLPESARTFEEALGLWRGPVRGDQGYGPIMTGSMTWLQECRLECLESYVEANLLLGRHRTMISQLAGLVAEYPLHESFYGQLMRAFQACNRRADALRVYQQAWTVLDHELGLEPGPQLQELQRSLLRGGRPVPAPVRLAG